MISFVHGKLAYKMENAIVVDTGGVGYEIFMPSTSPVFLYAEGDDVRIYTVMIVKEDEMSLYGFTDRGSVNLFRLLISVSGVGAKAAMAILSAMSASEASKAITFGDATMLTRANGVGKKSAERIILELSDKVGKLSGVVAQSGSSPAKANENDPKSEAIEVLLTLGYTRSEAGSVVMSIDKEDGTPEEYVKLALKSLG